MGLGNLEKPLENTLPVGLGNLEKPLENIKSVVVVKAGKIIYTYIRVKIFVTHMQVKNLHKC